MFAAVRIFFDYFDNIINLGIFYANKNSNVSGAQKTARRREFCYRITAFHKVMYDSRGVISI